MWNKPIMLSSIRTNVSRFMMQSVNKSSGAMPFSMSSMNFSTILGRTLVPRLHLDCATKLNDAIICREMNRNARRPKKVCGCCRYVLFSCVK